MTWPTLCPNVGDKISGCLDWVADKTPLAVVDDHFCVAAPYLLERLYERRAPTIVISPDPVIDLGGALVAALLEFAADPLHPRFAARHPWVMYADPALGWGSGDDADPRGWLTERGEPRALRDAEYRHFKHADAPLKS